MPSWDALQKEIRQVSPAHDQIRRKYLRELAELTGRPAIIYYSGWNEKGTIPGLDSVFAISDSDNDGFMAAIYGLNKDKGLDLVLHTPGGDIAATEALVGYLRSIFGTDIRVIIPHLAMSAGTMVALAAKEIVMGKHSSIGPIDPQFGGIPAHGIIEEFETAREAIKNDPASIPLWQPIIGKYHPTLIGEAQKAVALAEQITKKWLMTGMFAAESDANDRADKVVAALTSHSETLVHNRHYSADAAKTLGLKVHMLEDTPELQEAVLTIHHACILTLSETPAVKIIENSEGAARIVAVQLATSAGAGGSVALPINAPPVAERSAPVTAE